MMIGVPQVMGMNPTLIVGLLDLALPLRERFARRGERKELRRHGRKRRVDADCSQKTAACLVAREQRAHHRLIDGAARKRLRVARRISRGAREIGLVLVFIGVPAATTAARKPDFGIERIVER